MEVGLLAGRVMSRLSALPSSLAAVMIESSIHLLPSHVRAPEGASIRRFLEKVLARKGRSP